MSTCGVIDMKRKLILSLLMIGSLFIMSASSVLAADEFETIDDNEDDVYDAEADTEISTKPHIDIVSATYEREGSSVTLTLMVKGNIQNKGDIDELYDDEATSIEYVAYQFALLTSIDTGYEIVYINNQCQLTYYPSVSYEDLPETENLTENDFSVDGSTLTISFPLKNASETFLSLEVASEDAKISPVSYEWFIDYAPDDFDDDPDDGENGENGNGTQNGDDTEPTNGDSNQKETSNTNLFLFAGIIIAIVVLGIAVLVYILRR